MAQRPIPTAQRWTPPSARVEGERILKMQQLRQQTADAKRQAAEAEVRADVAIQKEQENDREIDALREDIRKLHRDLPKMVGNAGGGGGKRTAAKYAPPINRTIATGTGLNGGGNLSSDRTIALNPASIASLAKADTAVQPENNLSDLDDKQAARLTLGLGQTARSGFFWEDLDGDPPNLVNLNDRIRVGAAVGGNTNRITGYEPPDWGDIGDDWAMWAHRDADLMVMSQRGSLAVVGMSKTSDGAALLYPPATIGVSGFAYVDSPASAAWCGYFDGELSDGTGWLVGMEIAIKNSSGVNHVSIPYGLGTEYGGTTGGIWIAGGGHNAYGGIANAPTDFGIAFVNNEQPINTGIIFDSEALTRDGGGSATMIAAAKGHGITWFAPTEAPGAYITSTVDDHAYQVGLKFDDSAIYLMGSNATMALFQHSGTDESFFRFTNGAAPAIEMLGSAAEIDVWLKPKGNGVVRMAASHPGAGNAATYRMYIKDAAGTPWTIALSPV